MSLSESKRMYVPTFTGEESDFQVWWMRFKTYAMIAGFASAITCKMDADLPGAEVLATDDDDGKERKKHFRDSNSLAMATLTMAFTSASLMGVITDAVTSDWPNGLAYKVVECSVQEIQTQ